MCNTKNIQTHTSMDVDTNRYAPSPPRNPRPQYLQNKNHYLSSD